MEQIAENRMNTDEIDISPCKIVCRKSREKTTKSIIMSAAISHTMQDV